MSIEEKQIYEKNRLAKVFGMIIAVSTIAFTLLVCTQGMTTGLIIRLVVGVIAIIVIEANAFIMDSITNLSATSEEVAASTDTVLSVSENAMSALDGMNSTLAEINSISKNMENICEK